MVIKPAGVTHSLINILVKGMLRPKIVLTKRIERCPKIKAKVINYVAHRKAGALEPWYSSDNNCYHQSIIVLSIRL